MKEGQTVEETGKGSQSAEVTEYEVLFRQKEMQIGAFPAVGEIERLVRSLRD